MELGDRRQLFQPHRFLLSLPERTTRALAAVGGGLLHESAVVLVPESLRRTRIYQALVARLLRLTVELLGDVKGVFPQDGVTAQKLLARKTAGNAIEIASFLAVGWSPIWLLAAASDIIGGARVYLNALVEELKTAGALAPDADIQTFEQLLGALEGTSGALAENIDLLPLSLPDLRTAWESLSASAAELPDAARLQSIFADLQLAAMREGRTLLEISSAVGLGAVRAGLKMGQIHLFDYYRSALGTIASEGLALYLRRVSLPYLVRAVEHLDPQAETYTDRLLDRIEAGSGILGRRTNGERLEG
jgi:hypothetical protein